MTIIMLRGRRVHVPSETCAIGDSHSPLSLRTKQPQTLVQMSGVHKWGGRYELQVVLSKRGLRRRCVGKPDGFARSSQQTDHFRFNGSSLDTEAVSLKLIGSELMKAFRPLQHSGRFINIYRRLMISDLVAMIKKMAASTE